MVFVGGRLTVPTIRPTQTVNGFTFPAAPGPAPKGVSETVRWQRIVESLRFIRSQLATSDRAFYRQLIGVESLALANLRDRADPLGGLAEPQLSLDPELPTPFGS